MKKWVTNLIKILIFVAVLVLALLGVSNVLEEKTSRFYREQIFQQDTPIDVLIIGSSHAKNGISPYYFWKDYGITSYNFASSGEKVQLSYYSLKDVIETVKPRVVLIDDYLSSTESKTMTMDYGYAHESIDYMNIDSNKIEAARLLSDSSDKNTLSFLSNIYAYHYRWKELKKDDFVENYSAEKGALYLAGGKSFDEIPLIEGSIDESVKESSGYDYLNRIMDLCEKNNVEFLFVNIPFINQNEKTVNSQVTLIENVNSRGYKSLFYPEIMDGTNLDSKSDYANLGHVNVIGAKKVTDFFGKYLSENMGIQDHRADEGYDSWTDFLHSYDEARLEKAKEATDAYSYVMTFWDSEKYKVKIVTSSGEINDELMKNYVTANNIETVSLDSLEDAQKSYIDDKFEYEDFTDNTMAVLIINRDNNEIVAFNHFVYYDGYK